MVDWNHSTRLTNPARPPRRPSLIHLGPGPGQHTRTRQRLRDRTGPSAARLRNVSARAAVELPRAGLAARRAAALRASAVRGRREL
eukprot:2590039-Rhodomonas_salina.1